MNIDALIPPVLLPYKAWIVLAFFFVTYVVRPSMPAPKMTGPTASWGYVFVFNIMDKLAGNFGNSAHTADNVPYQNLPQQVSYLPPSPAPMAPPVAPAEAPKP